MAYREIVKVENDILRKRSKEVTHFGESLWQLLDDMTESMYKFRGMGIASVQVGILKRVVIVDVNNAFFELVNPVLVNQSGLCEDEEGCLSVPNVRGIVPRPERVTVTAQDRYGNYFTITAEKMLARCLCHEIDHLNGILFTDKMTKEIKE